MLFILTFRIILRLMGGNRLIFAHVQFNVLNELVSEDMVREFSENEVRRAVWE